jgi:hypothetical protein
MTHKTVRVQYGDLEADIDVKMAPLILECAQHETTQQKKLRPYE